ncbi:glycosyltransferase family 4 protein [Sphingobacterium kitahiroshimense]|uniref:Glycosyltransferase family 4 protein n=1 Tax=Sphingobacterium kitahiroshimense TaxID=470446 RepID=A0ABV0C0Q1_9SPHI
MKVKKVLHIVSVSFSLRYFVGNQFHYFKEKGYEFHVACSDSSEFIALSREFGFTPFPVSILRSINPLQDIKSIYSLYRYIRREQFDIVIAHSPKGGLIGILAAYFARVPKRVFFRHGLVFETVTGVKKHLLINIERLIGFCATSIVNVSPSVTRVSDRLHLNASSKNVLLGKGTCNGIDITKFKLRYGYKDTTVITIGFVGRLSKDKGVIDLIDAWKLLCNEYKAIRLMLIGPLDERDPLPEETLLQIYEDLNIDYVGGVKDTSLYYNKMDIFVLPSYREGFPTVTLEAAASGLPVVTTKVTGCIDSIVENVTGIFAKNTADSLYTILKYYIDNQDISQIHGKNGHQFVRDNFSEDFVYKQIEDKIL